MKKNKIYTLLFFAFILTMPIYVNAKIISEVELGSYINYYPSETSYTTSTNTGTTASTINPSELTSWRVLNTNADNTVEIISTNVSTDPIKFYGTTGYRNYVNELQNASQSYINPLFANSARAFGYNGQILVLNNNSNYDSTWRPWDYTTSNNNNEAAGGGDMKYQRDVNLLTAAGIPITTTKINETTNSYYYIASRRYVYTDWSTWYFDVRFVDSAVTGNNLRRYAYYESGLANGRTAHYFRPVVTLKSDLELTGNGKIDDPYKIILYTIEFNSNEGSTIEDQYVYNVDSKTTKPIDPTKEGHIFKGWYKDEELEEEWNFDNDVVTSNITLYAKWQKKEYNVEFTNNGHGENLDNQKVLYKDKIVKPTELKEEGYQFEGWYIDEELTNKYDFDSEITSNIILYAKWNKIIIEEIQKTDEELEGNTKLNEDSEPNEVNPKTYDGIINSIILLNISIIGIVGIVIYRKKLI